MKSYPDCFWYLVPVTCDNPFYSPDGPTVGRLGNLTKWRPAASDLIIVSLVVVIVHFLNCFNNFSRFRYSYMYIMMFITYICIFSDKLPSHIGLQTFGLLLILSRFIGLPRYSYQPHLRNTGLVPGSYPMNIISYYLLHESYSYCRHKSLSYG